MANTNITHQELRIDIRNPELTQVYILIENLGNDEILGVQGWHHKTFPASMSILEIVQAWAGGYENPLLWALKIPD